MSRPIAAIALVCLSFPSFAMRSPAMHFERLSVDDGLSQSTVKSITQDESGFLWFGTENGLNRYDGYNFEQYRRDHTAEHTLENEYVWDMANGADGVLWIATDGGGVARWDPERDEFSVLRHDPENDQTISDDTVHVVLVDPRGVLWIGTRHGGLDKLDIETGAITHFRRNRKDSTTLSHNNVHDLALDAEGMLWIATQKGLNRLDPATGRVERFLHDPLDAQSLSQNIVRSLLIDRKGMLWAGTRNGGLNLLTPETGKVRRFLHDADDRNSLSHNNVEALFEDSDGRLWVGTGSGLNLFNRERDSFSVYRHDPTDPYSLSDDSILSLFQDRSGVLWIGTQLNGLSKWNPRSWSFGHINVESVESGGLNNSHVSSFTEDPEGNLWVGTFGGGVNILSDSSDTMRYLKHRRGDPDSLSDDRVMAQLTDSRGKIWVGTMGGGVNRIDPASGKIEVFLHDPDDPNSLAADAVMTIFEDSAGRVWIGTFGGGVSRFDRQDRKFTNFANQRGDVHSLSGSRATAIVEDRQGRIWVGTDGGGLNYFDAENERWNRFQHDPSDPQSLSDNTIYTMYVDVRGQLWIGTRAGLDRLVWGNDGLTSATFGSVTRRDGLANDTIYGIQPDGRGNLWLSTNFGLARYNPLSGLIRNFHRSHGLQGEEFNFGAHYVTSQGELLFGGPNGFNAFDPSRLELTSAPPRVALTSFMKLNTPAETEVPYEQLESVDLDYSDDVVTFEFSALDFVSASRNRYAYILQGFDKDWVDAGTERRITYTNLDAGNYVLRVRAANSEGVWSEQGIELPIYVAPPPWQTWWAYLLYFLAAGSTVHLLMRTQRLKLEREAEYSKRLEREVTDRTQELADRNQDLHAANEKLHEASHTDALTGLRNRRYLFDEIAKEIDLVQRHDDNSTHGRRRADNDDFVFIMVDLDHFKPVNDSLGHLAGDKMLLQVTDALLEACRSTDVVIRWGGDEFLVIARESNRDDAARLVERIRSRIAERVFSLGDGHVARTTCSIGFACYPFLEKQPDLLNWEQVLGIADVAMYRSKELRNAWSGVYGRSWSESGDKLVTAIKTEASALSEQGLVHIVDSVSLAEQDIA